LLSKRATSSSLEYKKMGFCVDCNNHELLSGVIAIWLRILVRLVDALNGVGQKVGAVSGPSENPFGV